MKRVVISSFITLVILALIAAGWFYFQRLSIVTTDPVNAIPSNAVFFVEAKSARNILTKLSAEDLWASLTNTDSTGTAHLKLLDSALLSDADVKELWENKTIYLSAHLNKANSFDYIYFANVPPSWTDEMAEHFIAEAFHVESPASRRVYENTIVRELEISPERNFSFTVSKGVFIGSFTSFLIDDAIRQLKSGTPVNKSKAFSKITNTSDQQTDVTLYINYISLREFLSSFSSGGSSGLFNAIGSFARWSRLDATIRSNGLLFHGTSATTDTNDFISTLRSQQPQRIDVTEILPARTALLISFGLSNPSGFFMRLLSKPGYYEAAGKRKQTITMLEKKFNADIEHNLTHWIGNEIALVITEPGSISFANSSYACIKATDIDSAFASLQKIQNAVNKSSTFSKPEEYRKHPIGNINLGGLVPVFYSNLFGNISKFYFTTAARYIVITNQPSALRSFIDDYEDNKTLSDDPAFKNVSRTAERSSNFFLYANLARAKNIFRSYASDDLNSMIDKNQTILNRFSAFTFQLVNRNENFATTVQLLQAKEKINNANLLWTTQLDTAVSMPSFVFTNAESKNKFVLVQDEGKNLYLLDDAGNIAWKKVLPEKILGRFHVVDAYRNGQQQILFNTSSVLYMLDLDGNDYGNYPIHLPALAASGCEVFDFDGAKNYKIFIACSNRMVYAYEISGKPMSGWVFGQPVSNVTDPLQYFHAKDKDYLLLYNHHGTVFVLDKKGTIRIALKQTFVAKNSTFCLVQGDSLEEDHLVTTDSLGRVVTIFFNGVVKLKSYGRMSPEHAFKAADVDGDGKQDYVFLDHHQLNVMRPDSSLIYYHLFPENILPEIHSFSFTTSMQQLGFGCADENKFYLMNKDGSISNGFPVKGFTGISENEWGTEGKRILLTTGTDNSIYLYNLE